MKSGIQSREAIAPLVLSTNPKHPFAKLVIRGEIGQIVQQWLIQQNKCTLGSASSCAVRCELPGIAPYHALLVIGAKQTFIRALAPKLMRSGKIVNELLLTDTENQFEIAGHKFELLRSGALTQQSSNSATKETASRLKFTLARPFELNRPSKAVAPEVAAMPQTASAATGYDSKELNARWISDLIQSAVLPLELQLMNLIEPLTAVQSELTKQKQNSRLKSQRRRLPKVSRGLLKSQSALESAKLSSPESIEPPLVADVEQSIPIAIEVLFAKQSASLDILSERLTDVNSQLSSLERIVADNISSTTENLPAPTPSNQAAIDRLQETTEQLGQLLRDLQSRQTAVEKTDGSWREEIREQICHLQQTLTRPTRNADSEFETAKKFHNNEVAHSNVSHESKPLVTFVQSRAHAAEAAPPVVPGVLPGFAPVTSAPPNLKSPADELASRGTETKLPGEQPQFGYNHDELAVIDLACESVSSIPPVDFEDYAPWIQEEVIDSLPAETPSAAEFFRPAKPVEKITAPKHFESAEQADASQFGFTSGDDATYPPAATDQIIDESTHSKTYNNSAFANSDGVAAANSDRQNPVASNSSAAADPVSDPWSISASQAVESNHPESNALVDNGYQFELAGTNLLESETPQSIATSLPSWWTEDEQAEAPDNSGMIGQNPVEQTVTDDIGSPNTATIIQGDEQDVIWPGDGQRSNSASPSATGQLDTDDARQLSSLLQKFGKNQPSSVPNADDDASDELGEDSTSLLAGYMAEDEPIQAAQLDVPTANESRREDFDIASEGELQVENHLQSRDGGDWEVAYLEIVDCEEAVEAEISDSEDLEFDGSARSASSGDQFDYGNQGVTSTPEPMYKLPEQSMMQVSVAESQSTKNEIASAEPEEESIEDYMSRLLARMRGGEGAEGTPAVKQHSPVPKQNVSESSTPSANDSVSQKTEFASPQSAQPQTTRNSQVPTSPFNPEEYVPRVLAPEKSKNLAAMRELANNSARSAIQVSARRKYGTALVIKLIIASVGLGVGSTLIMINGVNVNIGLIATVASFLVAFIWGFDALSTLKPILHANIDKEDSQSKLKSDAVQPID